MKIKKNWFFQFCIALAITGIAYAIIIGFSVMSVDDTYVHANKGLLILAMFAIWGIFHGIAAFAARCKIVKIIRRHKKWMNVVEAILVVVILGAAVLVRLRAITAFPIEPISDYKTYYEIARLLKEGTLQELGKGYCDYISMFPHVMGYSYILRIAFSWFGTSVLWGQYLNVFFSVSTVYFVYRIARKLGGRVSGLFALLFSAFWISQVLYITILSAEYAFTFFLYLCIWLFVSLVKDYDKDTDRSILAIVLHIVLGIVLAITCAIRPMGQILLIAILICLLPQKMKLENIPRNNIPLAKRIIERGWMRCILIIIPFYIVSGIITARIESEIDRTLPSMAASFGYNMLVGLNIESEGGWNEADATLFSESFEETNSPEEAHIICRDLAFARLQSDPKDLLNLFVKKYELLWGNDDYGATWNIMFLEEQGNLVEEKSEFLYLIRDFNAMIYLVTICLALIGLLYLLRKEGNGAYVLVLLFLGTAAIHLIVESQNRNHYFILQTFMILAAMAIGYIGKEEEEKRIRKMQIKSGEDLVKKQENDALEKYHEMELQMIEQNKQAMVNTFDMESAIQSGHIIMTVTPTYGKEIIEDKKDVVDKILLPMDESTDNNLGHEQSSNNVENNNAQNRNIQNKNMTNRTTPNRTTQNRTTQNTNVQHRTIQNRSVKVYKKKRRREGNAYEAIKSIMEIGEKVKNGRGKKTSGRRKNK